MERDKLKGSTRRFLTSQGSERDQIFREEIFPFIEEMINGVFLSLKITCLSQDDIKDIKQDIYLKILTRIKTQGLTGVRSFKNYYFISIKNITIDYLRSHNREKQFYEILINIINSRKNCRLFDQVIDRETDHFFDADLDRLVKIGTDCPVCKKPLFNVRNE